MPRPAPPSPTARRGPAPRARPPSWRVSRRQCGRPTRIAAERRGARLLLVPLEGLAPRRRRRCRPTCSASCLTSRRPPARRRGSASRVRATGLACSLPSGASAPGIFTAPPRAARASPRPFRSFPCLSWPCRVPRASRCLGRMRVTPLCLTWASHPFSREVHFWSPAAGRGVVQLDFPAGEP